MTMSITRRRNMPAVTCTRIGRSVCSPCSTYLRVFRGVSKTNLPGYVGFFQFLRNFYQRTAFEQAEMILYAALDPAIASKARQGDFVRYRTTSTR